MFFLQIFYNLELYFIECVQMTLEDIPKILCPETDLERRILTMPEILQGLMWGEPRYGHPEGKVVFHVREIYFNIDNLTPAPTSESNCVPLLYCTTLLNSEKIEAHHAITQNTTPF